MATSTLDYTITVVNLDKGLKLWGALYKRKLASGAGWTDGDRVGYRTAYGFLMRADKPVGRFQFHTVEGANSYMMVTDKYMNEGSRYFDGRINTNPNLIQLNDAPPPTESYDEVFTGSQRPVITYEQTDGKVLETRNYPAIVPAPGVTWQQKLKTDKRITVVAYENTTPVVVVYYDSLVPDVVMRSNI